MDDRRFDALTRSLASGLSRRTVLRGLFGGIAGAGAATTVPSHQTSAQVLCESDEDCEFCDICYQGECVSIHVGDDFLCCEVAEDNWVCQECCADDDCGGPCAICDHGVCASGCEEGTLCCEGAGGRDVCNECCEDADCGDCELCYNGACLGACSQSQECCLGECVEFGECCSQAGGPCGSVGTAGPAPIDCCSGLLCCEGELSACAECCQDSDCGDCEVCYHGQCTGGCGESELCCDAEEDYCAECCGDADCPKGSICCNKACHEIECCIDDILTGGDPNARCPGDCGCFEGLCVDENQRHCVACDSSKDCPKGECCCKDGTCSDECCPPLCDTDKDCAGGACCCKDGICSKNCCDKPDDEDGEPVEKLPSTGVGDDDQGLGMLGAAAIGAAAAYMTGKKLRQPAPEGITVEE